MSALPFFQHTQPAAPRHDRCPAPRPLTRWPRCRRLHLRWLRWRLHRARVQLVLWRSIELQTAAAVIDMQDRVFDAEDALLRVEALL